MKKMIIVLFAMLLAAALIGCTASAQQSNPTEQAAVPAAEEAASKTVLPETQGDAVPAADPAPDTEAPAEEPSVTADTAAAQPAAETAAEPAADAVSSATPEEADLKVTGEDIGLEKAKEIAFAHAGLSAEQIKMITRMEGKLGREDDKIVYKIRFVVDHTEYEYEIDPANGDILDFDRDNDQEADDQNPPAATGTLIGEEKAREIALGKVPGAAAGDITECKLDEENGRRVYEIEICYNGLEYDFEIDAVTGEILQMKSETKDKH